MRSFLVQSYCNGCVSGEVNLPTVSLLSRACLFKILYLSTKRNFTCFIFLRRSFPLNDVHHSKKNNNNKVKWVFLCSSSYAKLTQLILLLSYIVFLNKILLKGTLKKLFINCNYIATLIIYYNYVWMFIILELIKTYQKTNTCSNDFSIQSYLFKANGELALTIKRFWVFY